MEIEIKRYEHTDKIVWDNFVLESKNGTFLFNRDFMEYHSDRFIDFSLLFYLKGILIATLPANICDKTLYSHQGLTYGGLILSTYIKTIHVLEIFKSLKNYLLSQNIHQIIYKTIPHIYHKQPAEEDLYALFKNDAKLISRAISSCINQKNLIEYSLLRKRKINKLLGVNLQIKENDNFDAFWSILENNLSRIYNVKPTHSVSEIKYLKSFFSNKIHLWEIHDPEGILAGCTIFECNDVCHVQYIAATQKGKRIGALDKLLNQLIISVYNKCKYFDFGISTEDNGLFLNEGLISQKEGFGARGIVYDIYKIELK